MNRLRIFLAGIVAAWGVAAHATVEIIPTHGRNIYRLALAKIPEGTLIIGGTYDNRLCAFTLAGEHRWDLVLPGFAFDLATGDLDGDGRDEIVVAGADGVVTVADSAGRKIWSADLQAPVYQVAVARLDGRQPVVLAGGVSRCVTAFSPEGKLVADAGLAGAVRFLRAGDFDGDGRDEVAVIAVGRQVDDLRFLRGPSLEQAEERIPSPAVRDPAMGLRQANGLVADVSGDGFPELVYKPGAYTLRGGARALVSFPERFLAGSYDQHYTMRFVAAGDLTGAAGPEFVLVEGPQVKLCDAHGKELGHATAALGFTDAIYVPGSPRGSVLLGSSPNGDDNLYRVSFTRGWEKELAQLERRGVMADIAATLAQTGRLARTAEAPPLAAGEEPIDVVLGVFIQWGRWSPGGLDRAIEEIRADEKEFPYARLRFGAYLWTGEDAPLLRPDGAPWPRDRRMGHQTSRAELVAAARRMEAEGCSFWMHLGHGCAPAMELETVAALLEAAPRTLRGFVSAEDEELADVPYYLEHFLRPVMEMCLRHGKRVMLRQKNVWWAYWPSHPVFRELILNGRYRSVLLPCVEDSNSRSADLNLASRVGLWLAGEVDGWAARSIADQFSFNRLWEWEYPLTGHPSLRYNVTQAALGARVFTLQSGERRVAGGPWTRVGAEGATTFLHLLGRGVISPPRREQLKGISPVALVMNGSSARFQAHGANGHQVDRWGLDGTDKESWALDRLDAYWGMAPLPPTDVATYLWNRSRRDAAQIAATPSQGLVVVAPAASAAKGPWTIRWETDGDSLRKDGQVFPLAEARTRLLADLAQAGAQLPVQVEGRVFHQVIAETPRRYLLVLVDPGWLDPAARTVTFSLRLPGQWTAVDRLSGEMLGQLNQPREVRVPAGGLRLIELRRTDEGN